MTQPTKPSAGALRAAKSIMSTKAWLADHTWDDGEATEGFEHQLAEIIDRETGVGELLEIIRPFLSHRVPCLWTTPPTYWYEKDVRWQPSKECSCGLEQAIAKCEGKSSE